MRNYNNSKNNGKSVSELLKEKKQKVFREIIVINFLNLMKSINAQCQEVR